MKWNKIRVVYGNCRWWCIYLNREWESPPVIQLPSGNFVKKKSLKRKFRFFSITLTHVAIIVNEIWNGDLSNFSFPTVERLEIQNLRWTNKLIFMYMQGFTKLLSLILVELSIYLLRSRSLHLSSSFFSLSRPLSNKMKIPQHVSIYTSRYMCPFGDRRERKRAPNLLPLISKEAE